MKIIFFNFGNEYFFDKVNDRTDGSWINNFFSILIDNNVTIDINAGTNFKLILKMCVSIDSLFYFH